MSTLKQLKSRYPYMFAGPHIGIAIARGWENRFSGLCAEIDDLLGDDKRGFHWRQVKEKLGWARLYWTMTGRGHGKKPTAVCERINVLVNDAAGQTRHTCIVCGQHGEVSYDEHHMLVLCPGHAEARRAGHLEYGQIWREDDENER